MKKGVGSGVGFGSGSINQRYGFADPDPDPHKNVTDPQHLSEDGQPNSSMTIFSDNRSLRSEVARIIFFSSKCW